MNSTLSVSGYLVKASLAAALFAVFAGCGGGGGASGPSSSPSPPPPPPTRVYISDGGTPGTIFAFNLPLTPASTPSATFNGDGGPIGMALDPMNRLFVVNRGGMVQVFSQPINSGAAPSFAFLGGSGASTTDIAFDRSADAFITEGRCQLVCSFGATNVFTTPITNSSSASFSISANRAAATGVAFDSMGNLWITAEQNPYASSILEYQPPFSAASVASLSLPSGGCSVGIAFDAAGNLYAADPCKNGVHVYSPPFTASTTAAFTIPTAGNAEFIAFDAAGKAYVTTNGDELLVFTPPFSSTSVPSVTVSIPGAPSPAGIAIGP